MCDASPDASTEAKTHHGWGGGYPVLDPTLKQSQSQPNQHGPQVLPGAPGLSPHAGKALQGCGLCSDPHGQLKFHRPR